MSLFVIELFFNAAVKEECHVGVFLSFWEEEGLGVG